MKRVWLFLALLLTANAAQAAPIIIAAITYFAASQAVAAIITLAYTAYTAYRVRRAAKKAADKAIQDYNSKLTDRLTTVVSEQPPKRIVYGSGLFGGDVVAVFTSDLVLEDGKTKKDGMKHLVVVCASHRIKAIRDLRIAGDFCGVTGSEGWATANAFLTNTENTKTVKGAGNLRTLSLPTLSGPRLLVSGAEIVVIGVQASKAGQTLIAAPGSWTVTDPGPGSTKSISLPNAINGITIDASYTWSVTYNYNGVKPSVVYVSKFLGTSTQTANAYLKGKVPALWTDSDRLRGLAGAVISLDLTDSRFQGGVPEILFDLEGRDEIYDPRDGLFKYTRNPALILDDWMRSEWGFNVVPNTSATAAAANACDVATTFTNREYNSSGELVTNTYSAARYEAAGSFTTADDKEQVLQQILTSFCGQVINGADWRILAGAWTDPVRTLGPGDDMGPIQILQAGEPIDDVFNGVRGKFIPIGQAAEAEINPPYQNTTFVAADGEELWEDVSLPFTDDAARALNIARILTETNRNGLEITYPAKLKHWDLEVGQRIALNDPEYGWTNKTFQIINWDFSLENAVALTMREDDPGAYDTLDAAISDPTPNTNLPSVATVNPPAITSLTASTAELLPLADGTIIPRVLVQWSATTSAYMTGGGYYEVAWCVPSQLTTDDGWVVLRANEFDRQVYLQGLKELDYVVVRLVAVNSLGRRSSPVFQMVYVAGKTTAPVAPVLTGAVQVAGGVRISRTPSTELDWGYGLYEVSANGGLTWASIAGTQDRDGLLWNTTSPGAFTLRARDVDTTGHIGPYSNNVTVNVGGYIDPSATLFIKLNQGSYSTTDYGEAYIHGFSGGVSSDVNGSILVNGVSTAVPKGVLYTSRGPDSEFILWDASGVGFSTNIGMRPYVFARKTSSGWQYDNNTDWTRFTITSGMWVIGLLVTGESDDETAPGLTSAAMFNTAIAPEEAAATGSAALWDSVGGRTRTYRVGALGFGATGNPIGAQLYDADNNGATLVGGGSMYRVVKIHRTTKNLTDLGAYIPALGITEANNMAAVLNSITSEYICVVFTYDEPRGGRLLGGLADAMYRNGASRAVYGSMNFQNRGAYILVGVGGCGEGNGAECYAGAVDSDPNAWCDLTFQITATGALIVSGDASGARTITDYGYVGTTDIAASAATSVYQDSVDLTGSTIPATAPTWQSYRTFTIGPAASAGVIEFTATLDCFYSFDDGQNVRWAYSLNGGSDVEWDRPAPPGTAGTSFKGRGTTSGSIAVSLGDTLVLKVQGLRPVGQPSPLLYLSSMRATLVKR